MPNYQGFYNGVPLTFKNESGSSGITINEIGRPSDWLSMPKPKDDEIYLLVLVPDKATTLIAFTVTCEGEYKVELGTVKDDKFVYIDGMTTKASGEKYEVELVANNYEAITNTGMKQIMVKISGNSIYTWVLSEHSKNKGFSIYPIMDIRCRLPEGTAFKVSITGDSGHILYPLRYFSWEGPNQLTDTSNMFLSCYSLQAVLELDMSKVTNALNMFQYCYTLMYLPEMDCSKIENASGMFHSCYALSNYPSGLEKMQATDMSGMFKYNMSANAMPKMDFYKATNIAEMYYNCTSLEYIPQMNIQLATTMTNTFMAGVVLAAVTLDPTVEGWPGCNIQLQNKAMGHDALMDLINSLPTVTVRRTLNISGNYGASSLTKEEKAIATSKNWDLTT